jgi:hypothetical protein
VAAVGAEATVAAEIRPGGLPTTYRLQYITEAAYLEDGEAFGAGVQETAESASIGSDNKPHEVRISLTGLTPETVYRYRVIATNQLSPAGGTAGPTGAFFTYVAPTFAGCANESLRELNESRGLPDCRAFELVSPPGTAEVYLPSLPEGGAGIPGTDSPMRVAREGNSVAYAGEAPGSGSGGSGNKGWGEGDLLLSARGAKGWSTTDITPAGEEPESYYEAFSGDLSHSVFYSDARPLAAGVQGRALYDRDGATGAFAPLFDSEPGTSYGAVTEGLAQEGREVLFESEAALAEGARTASTEELGHGNVYDYAEGSLRLVSVLPGIAAKPAPEATAGGLSAEGAEEIRATGVAARNIPPVYGSGDISSDGSRAFWTDLATGVIYMRLNPGAKPSTVQKGQCTEPERACTIQVSAKAAVYRTATPDGRYAYYTEDGELWRFDSESDTSEAVAAGPGAEVQGVVAVNQTGQDGSYLYFVADGKLSPEAEARRCETGGEDTAERREEAEGRASAGRGCNLYLLHEGTTRLVTVLLPGDNGFEDEKSTSLGRTRGDWRSVLGYRTAQTNATGTVLTFMSERRLGAYSNVNTEGGCGGAQKTGYACAEVYVYDAESGQIACASCDPEGVRPVTVSARDENGEGTYLPGNTGSLTHTARAIAADGDLVFFTTDQSLVPADANGEPDVYEWERQGSGSCVKGSPFNGGGCVYLLSSGKPDQPGYLLESDEAGENVLVITRAQLNPFDSGQENAALYDLRTGGGFPFSTPTENGEPPCTSAEACPCSYSPPRQSSTAPATSPRPSNCRPANTAANRS